MAAVLAGIASTYPADGQIADNKCRFLGNVISGYTPSDFATYWNQVSPENAGKWGSVESTRDVMQWGALDNAYQTAKTNGYPFKQHTFVWGQQQPGWIADLSPTEQKEEVEEWIKGFCERYPETDFIDVVNEPLHATPSYDLALGAGWNWVIWSFEKARQYCPNAKLILNDYNIISSESATDAYIALINMLKEKNLIDIIGEQGHFLETTPISTIKANLDKLHATGLPIHISEFDINIPNDIEQRDKYQQLFPLLWTHPGVQGITLWGYKQGEIWRTDAYLLKSDGTERPAMTWLKGYVPTVPGGTFCLPVTGIDDEEPGVSVFPNPAAAGRFNVTTQYHAQIEILDGQQKLVDRYENAAGATKEILLHGSPTIYIVKIITNGKTLVFKIVVR
jgi:endo-1,4-beta-xylanase